VVVYGSHCSFSADLLGQLPLLAAMFPTVSFLALNGVAERRWALRYNVRFFPTIIRFHKGDSAIYSQEYHGKVSLAALRNFLNSKTSKSCC